jgi:hypothetical protein
MENILNFELMRHWQNWFIIVLMLMIFSFVLDIVLTKFSTKEELK